MARVCELTGKRVASGNNVSHSVRRTKRKFYPNTQVFRSYSDILQVIITCKASTNGMRTVQKYGDIDQYLMHVSSSKLSPKLQKIRSMILNKHNS